MSFNPKCQISFKMKFRLFFGIFHLIFIEVIALPPKLSYNDCRFIDNTRASVELFCNQVKVNHLKNDCYSIYLNSSLMAVDRPKVNLLKFYDCGSDSKQINISSSFFNRFPKLRVLDLSNQTIKTLYFTFIDANNSVETINSSRNDLTELPKSTFNYMPNLTTVDFSYNKIRMIHSKIFEGAIKLTMINLSNNILAILAGESFSKCENLESLDLSVNQIQAIDKCLFVNNGKLKNLNLNGNPMKRFSFNAFSPLANSLKVDIFWKQIETLDINCRNIINNHFTNIYTIENVRIFNVSGCQAAEKFLEFLDKLSADVQVLDLSWNFISDISVDIFERFTNLQTLDLSHTNLSNIGFDPFSYQSRLISLDLSYNNLLDVDSTIFSRKFFHLEALNLEANQLTAVNNITSMNFPNLRWLAISKNQFSCKYLGAFLDRWANVEGLQLAGNPSRNQLNIEGIDCFQTEIVPKNNEKLIGYVENNNENLNVLRNHTNNDEQFIGEKSLQIWTFNIIAVLLLIILLNFIMIAFMCRSSRQRHSRRQNQVVDQIEMAERKIEKVTAKQKSTLQESENEYEEIMLQRPNLNPNPNLNQSLYDVPRFNTLHKSYL